MKTTKVVLLLEDHEGLSLAMRRVLEMEGYRVRTVTNAQAAFAVFSEEPIIDILIADLVLPGLSGREAANRIVAHHPDVKVLFTTGFSSADPELKDLAEFGFPIIRKPYAVPDLIAAVRKALEG